MISFTAKIFIIVSVCSFAYSLNLEDSYYFSGDGLYSKDINKGIGKNFLIVSVPKNIDSFKIPSYKIINKLKENNIDINSVYKIVTLKRDGDTSFEQIELFLKSKFEEKIPFLDIKNVKLIPKNHVDEDISSLDIDVKSLNFSRSKGVFFIQNGSRRYFFNYEVVASYTVYKAKNDMKRGDILNFENLYKSKESFKFLYDLPIKKENIGKYVLKQSVKKDSIITQRKVSIKYDIVKNQSIIAKLIDGNVFIELPVKALKSGYVGDVIPILKSDGVKLKGRVVSSKEVVID